MNDFPLWTAIVTPMKTNGKVDYKSFEKIIRRQEEAGNGVLVLGSTGEGLNLTSEEKREVVSFATNRDLEVPVMAGIGGFELSAQIEFMNFCDAAEVDAMLLVTPLYAKPGPEGQYAWFSELLAETNTPCMLYNVPSRTGVKMDPTVPGRLVNEFDNLMGVKEASGSVEEFKMFREEAPELSFYSGDDGMTPAFTAEGAVGLVSVASNVWPEETHKYVELCLKGETERVLPVWKEASAALFRAPNPIPAKVLLQKKGWIESDTVRLPLSLSDINADTEAELSAAEEKISSWYSTNK
ncbi:MAG: 4-hydroxy-tetrahydrodipicolinate synthase [Balneolaceae bacterium]|nr:4-hydroxy-tetrahydrodipicolinate synthase [Balneolaceae bacterium]